MLHLLPHWNWEGCEGETIPVHCYTSFDEVELRLNGRSLGMRRKEGGCRLVWQVPYEPGELRATAADGRVVCVRRTAGAAAALRLEADRSELAGDSDLAFVTASAVDAAGTEVPDCDLPVEISVTGAGEFAAVCNGDPTSLESFTAPRMRLFHGKLVVVIRAGSEGGGLVCRLTAPGLPPAALTLEVKPSATAGFAMGI